MACRFALATVLIVQEVGWTYNRTWQGGQLWKFNSATQQIFIRTDELSWRERALCFQYNQNRNCPWSHVCTSVPLLVTKYYIITRPQHAGYVLFPPSLPYKLTPFFSNSSTKLLSPEKKKTHHAHIQLQTHRSFSPTIQWTPVFAHCNTITFWAYIQGHSAH
jgi:hypothetical protein